MKRCGGGEGAFSPQPPGAWLGARGLCVRAEETEASERVSNLPQVTLHSGGKEPCVSVCPCVCVFAHVRARSGEVVATPPCREFGDVTCWKRPVWRMVRCEVSRGAETPATSWHCPASLRGDFPAFPSRTGSVSFFREALLDFRSHRTAPPLLPRRCRRRPLPSSHGPVCASACWRRGSWAEAPHLGHPSPVQCF